MIANIKQGHVKQVKHLFVVVCFKYPVIFCCKPIRELLIHWLLISVAYIL